MRCFLFLSHILADVGHPYGKERMISPCSQCISHSPPRRTVFAAVTLLLKIYCALVQHYRLQHPPCSSDTKQMGDFRQQPQVFLRELPQQQAENVRLFPMSRFPSFLPHLSQETPRCCCISRGNGCISMPKVCFR